MLMMTIKGCLYFLLTTVSFQREQRDHSTEQRNYLDQLDQSELRTHLLPPLADFCRFAQVIIGEVLENLR